jgi:hypothetical protein
VLVDGKRLQPNLTFEDVPILTLNLLLPELQLLEWATGV